MLKWTEKRNSLVIFLVGILLLCTVLIKVNEIATTLRQQNLRETEDQNEELIVVPLSKVIADEVVKLEQDDKRLSHYIWRHKHLVPPSQERYNLADPSTDPSRGQGQFIRKLLRNMTNGFFVEAGALDGETRSNTLFLEQHLKWKGLLVEGDPSNYAIMTTKKRKAWISNTCLAVKPYPHMATYLQSFNIGKIISSSLTNSEPPQTHTTKVQCMPLFSLLAALNVSTVDYFSLDVEGSELKVLKTIPFHKVFIKTLSVEFEHTAEGKKAILDFMRGKGYRLAGEVRPPFASWANDVILVHNSVLSSRLT